jgi:putative heme-binding domain-containing protein
MTLESWQKVLKRDGDKDRGRRAFFDPQLACARCHSAEGLGGEVGPDLSTIGRSNDRNRLITSIIDPSREIGPLYGQLTVETKSGETHSGVPLGIDFVDTLSLKLANGTRVKLQRDQVESIQSSTQSIMPAGLEKQMSVEEFRDLLAYLESLK